MDKPLIILHGTIKSPPMSNSARVEAGFMLRRAQAGERLEMPESRPMPSIGPNCHELRITDSERNAEWRVPDLIDDVAVVVLEVFKKETRATPEAVKETCRRRLRLYLGAKQGR